MGEELNQQLFYAPIGSDDEPIRLNDDIDIDFQIPDLSPLPKMFGIGMNEEQVVDYKNPFTIKFRLPMGEVQRNKTQMRIHTASRNTLAAWNAIKI